MLEFQSLHLIFFTERDGLNGYFWLQFVEKGIISQMCSGFLFMNAWSWKSSYFSSEWRNFTHFRGTVHIISLNMIEIHKTNKLRIFNVHVKKCFSDFTFLLIIFDWKWLHDPWKMTFWSQTIQPWKLQLNLGTLLAVVKTRFVWKHYILSTSFSTWTVIRYYQMKQCSRKCFF